MQHPTSEPWLWDARIQAIFDHLGIIWQVLPKSSWLTPEQLGSSPGDICWTGEMFLIESSCPQAWVVHDLAHWLVCKRNRPGVLNDRNFGHESYPKRDRRIQEDESVVSDVNIALLKYLELPYQSCADVIGVDIYGDFEEVAMPYIQELLPLL